MSRKSVLDGKGGWRLPGITQALVLLAAAQFSPMALWSTNLSEIGFPDGLFAWIGVVWLVAVGLWMIAMRLGAAGERATAVVFWFVLSASLLGLLSNDISGGSVTLVLLLVAFCVLVYRLAELPGFHFFHGWVVLFVAISPLASAALATATTGVSEVEELETVDIAGFEDTRDVVLVVFDAHGSAGVLDEFYSDASATVRRLMSASGTQIAPEMMSNYTLTHLSLSSVFDMGYPLTGTATVGEAEWADMMQNVRGDNNLVRAFKSQGYRLVVVESGWSGFHCSTEADVCVGGPWPDEVTMLAFGRTLFRPVTVGMLEATARGSHASLKWMESGLPDLVQNAERDLIMVHLTLPHPPLRYDRHCDLTMEPGLGGRTIGSPQFSEEEVAVRKEAYVDATVCASTVLSALAQSVGDEAVFVAIGDHGPDSLGQLFVRPQDWGSAEIRERLGVLFMTNAPCPIDDVHSLVNVGRWLLGCLASEQVEYLEDRFFVAVGSRLSINAPPEPIIEVTDTVQAKHDAQANARDADGT